MIALLYSFLSIAALLTVKFLNFSPAITLTTACLLIAAAFVCAYLDYKRNKGFNSYMKNVSITYLIFIVIFAYTAVSL
ncbi:hypothetical protein YDYSY3_20650 [Paenibacillus chitinolyticus]|uniref:hypothetical protein n=1 Tax=Paenibacillus chitinolyticus TaxID=79263 RepID=UPI0026E4AF3D|nr:hypothetical protein [Paenibacillus chitinolyticus]GKS11065.1 hypothetical protein YDYSY3_20650 [Paenibacillus chitinolyticus]